MGFGVWEFGLGFRELKGLGFREVKPANPATSALLQSLGMVKEVKREPFEERQAPGATIAA